MVELRLLSQGSLALEPTEVTAAATEVRDEVVLDEAEAPRPVWKSDMSSIEVWSGEVGSRRILAWSGWSRAVLGLRTLGVGEGVEGTTHATTPGDGDACKHTITVGHPSES